MNDACGDVPRAGLVSTPKQQLAVARFKRAGLERVRSYAVRDLGALPLGHGERLGCAAPEALTSRPAP
jgi:hypothetical protein